MNLIDHYPQVMQKIDDVQVYAEVVQEMIKRQNMALENLYNDQFLSLATENGLKKLEDKLKIHTLDTDSIEDRRARLLAVYIKSLPYTETTLRTYLNQTCGESQYDLKIDTQECFVVVRVALTRKAMMQVVNGYLEDVVPMNMALSVSLMYNQWKKFRPKTWSEVHAMAWGEIKEVVID